MAISTDTLLERIKLKSGLRIWRLLAIAAIGLLVINLVTQNITYPGRSYIARLSIEDIIEIDYDRTAAIDKLAEDKAVKAVIVSIDSPGGTATGGEELYYSLKILQTKKPVVVVMNNIATSAGYLIATAADRIFAHQATLTGSIGVILQAPNIKVLAEKIGVKMQVIKTGALKGSPSLFEEMDSQTEVVMQGLVDDFQEVFIDIIVEHRKLDKATIRQLADGRVYSGRQAAENGLIDAIGTEKDAVIWLEENKNIARNLKIFDIEHGDKPNIVDKLLNASSSSFLIPKELSMHGLLSIWNNTVIN